MIIERVKRDLDEAQTYTRTLSSELASARDGAVRPAELRLREALLSQVERTAQALAETLRAHEVHKETCEELIERLAAFHSALARFHPE